MNRQERRNSKNKDKPKTFVLNENQIKALKNEAVKEASNKAFILMLGLPLIVLRDSFGFGRERLSRFMDGLLYQYDSFDSGYVSLEDLLKTVEEETGIEVERRKK